MADHATPTTTLQPRPTQRRRISGNRASGSDDERDDTEESPLDTAAPGLRDKLDGRGRVINTTDILQPSRTANRLKPEELCNKGSV